MALQLAQLGQTIHKQLGVPGLAVAVLLLLAPIAVAAQTSAARPQVPSGAKAEQPAAVPNGLTSEEIAKRPYGPTFTKPIFPSSDPVQKQFTMSYVYNYAETKYTPSVPLPIVARSAAKYTTPEDAVIAIFSAARSGDYDGWLASWDDDSRKELEEQTKNRPAGKGYWIELWKKAFANARVVLVDRLDTVNYVILDVVIEHPGTTATNNIRELLVNQNGKWVASNRFGADNFVAHHDGPNAATSAVVELPIRPLLNDHAAAQGDEAQSAFLTLHNESSVVKRTVQ